MFLSVNFSLSVTSIHEHSLNFDPPDHHLILYSLLCKSTLNIQLS